MNLAEIAKQKVLGTILGNFLISTKGILHIVDTVFRNSECLGGEVNDQLAIRLVCGMCPPTKVFVDVGAHIGSIIDRVLRRNSSISIIAIEAVPDKVNILKRKFPQIIVHECAAGEREGSAPFYISTKHSGIGSLSAERIPCSDMKVIDVPVRTLDNIISTKSIDVMKIDVSGAKLAIIKGAKRLIAECRPIIMFDSDPDESVASTEALWRYLADQEYAVVLPNRVAHIDPGLKLDGFLESHLYPRRSTYYFGIPKERRDDVRRCARQILRFSC